METIPKLIKERIKKLSSKTFNLLVIEDHFQFHDVQNLIFKKVFPKANIYFLKSFADEKFEDQIVMMQYDFFAIDAHVAGLGKHSEYGGNAFKAIPFIREHNRKSLILAMSISPESNQFGLKLGADFALEKENLMALLSI